MKKSKNFSINRITFRCDAGEISGVGTGHVYRSINIANFLKKKFRLKKKEIYFLIKYQNKFKSGYEIVRKNGFKIIKVDKDVLDYSTREIKILNKFKSNLLIIDRLGKVNTRFINKINNNYKKKIILEDTSHNREKFDLSLNALIRDVKSVKNCKIGFEYMILRLKKTNNKKNLKNNHVFMFFGGFDKKKYSLHLLKILEKLQFKLNINVPKIYIKNLKKIKTKHKLTFFDNKDYLDKLKTSNIVFSSGGLILFDSILMNKKIICLPQYNHQKKNANELFKKGAIKYFTKINENKILDFFLKIYDNQTYKREIDFVQKQIINLKKIRRNYNLVGKIYEQSISR